MDQRYQFLVTSIIALYAAIISTILGISEIKRNQARIKVRISFSKVYQGLKLEIESEKLISIEAINVGFGEITINSVGFISKDNSKIQLLEPHPLKMPLTLKERKKCYTLIPCRYIRDNKNIYESKAVYFEDEIGKIYRKKISRNLKMQILNTKDDGYLLKWDELKGDFIFIARTVQ